MPLIAFEGTDGSGKGTQAKLLHDRLNREGFAAEVLSFPQYGKKSAGPVEEYLNGTYGKIDAYAAAVLFAVDHFDGTQTIRGFQDDGKIVILDRFLLSNFAHQGGKIPESEREKFVEWLKVLEHTTLQIPVPDQTLLLHVPSALGQSLVAKKVQRQYLGGGTHDLHEADLSHLERAEAMYLWLAQRDPSITLIECVEDGKLLTPEDIHGKVWKAVRPLLSK